MLIVIRRIIGHLCAVILWGIVAVAIGCLHWIMAISMRIGPTFDWVYVVFSFPAMWIKPQTMFDNMFWSLLSIGGFWGLAIHFARVGLASFRGSTRGQLILSRAKENGIGVLWSFALRCAVFWVVALLCCWLSGMMWSWTVNEHMETVGPYYYPGFPIWFARGAAHGSVGGGELIPLRVHLNTAVWFMFLLFVRGLLTGRIIGSIPASLIPVRRRRIFCLLTVILFFGLPLVRIYAFLYQRWPYWCVLAALPVMFILALKWLRTGHVFARQTNAPPMPLSRWRKFSAGIVLLALISFCFNKTLPAQSRASMLACAIYTQIEGINKAVEDYAEHHNGQYPASLDELTQATNDNPSLLKKEDLIDPWGKPIKYKRNEYGFSIITGPAKKKGISKGIISGADLYSKVSKLWRQKETTKVLEIADARLATDTNDIAGLILKAKCHLDFYEVSALSNAYLRVLQVGDTITTTHFMERYQLTSRKSILDLLDDLAENPITLQEIQEKTPNAFRKYEWTAHGSLIQALQKDGYFDFR